MSDFLKSMLITLIILKKNNSKSRRIDCDLYREAYIHQFKKTIDFESNCWNTCI